MKKFMTFVLLGMLMGMLIIHFNGCNSSNDSSASSQKAITKFSINGVEGTINETEKTIVVAGIPFGTDVTALEATFTTTGDNVEVDTTIQTSGVTSNDFTNPVTYTVIAEDNSKQNYTVTITVAASSHKAITAFSLGDNIGTINETEKTIAVRAPSGTDVTALIAAYTTTGVSVKVGSTFQASGQTPNDFTNPVVYTVTAADATTQDYTVTVTVTVVVVNRPATVVTASLTPNNPSGVTAGVFCVKTTSLTGSEVVTDPDGGTVIVREWYVNGVLKASGTNVLYGPFNHEDTVIYKVTADGVVSDSKTAKAACQLSC
jgi:hypothetical protein